MNCKEVQKNLPLFQQGLLNADMSRQVSDHLSSCESCRGALALENRISDSLDGLFSQKTEGMASVGVTAEWVLKKSHEDESFTNRIRSRMKIVYRFGAVAATVVLVFWFSFLFRHTPATEINLVQEAPVRTAFLNESPVRIPEIRNVQREITVTRLKENVIWISYKN